MATWLITGCSTGLGRAFAEAVLARGENVVATARDAAKVADLAEAHPGTALALALDVTDDEQVTSVVKAAEERFGGVDVLVNNAGYGYRAALEEGEDADVRQLFETRRALELPIIELAARRASDAERVEIQAVADQFHPGMELAEFRRLDREFHSLIARACGNPLLVELYGKVLARLFRSEDFDELLSAGGEKGDKLSLVDTLEDTKAEDPVQAFESEETKYLLAKAINTLPEREKIVVTLYYYEGLTLAEIGEVLGVTESRVSQIHSKSVLQLRAKLADIHG